MILYMKQITLKCGSTLDFTQIDFPHFTNCPSSGIYRKDTNAEGRLPVCVWRRLCDTFIMGKFTD